MISVRWLVQTNEQYERGKQMAMAVWADSHCACFYFSYTTCQGLLPNPPTGHTSMTSCSHSWNTSHYCLVIRTEYLVIRVPQSYSNHVRHLLKNYVSAPLQLDRSTTVTAKSPIPVPYSFTLLTYSWCGNDIYVHQFGENKV
jgi:hypothetical protein